MTTIQTLAIILFSVAFILVAFNLVKELFKAVNLALVIEKLSIATLVTMAGSFLAYGIFTTVVNLF